jgi:hypothetical protein
MSVTKAPRLRQRRKGVSDPPRPTAARRSVLLRRTAGSLARVDSAGGSSGLREIGLGLRRNTSERLARGFSGRASLCFGADGQAPARQAVVPRRNIATGTARLRAVVPRAPAPRRAPARARNGGARERREALAGGGGHFGAGGSPSQARILAGSLSDRIDVRRDDLRTLTGDAGFFGTHHSQGYQPVPRRRSSSSCKKG